MNPNAREFSFNPSASAWVPPASRVQVAPTPPAAPVAPEPEPVEGTCDLSIAGVF
jgi:hypothetical protein